MGRTRTVTVKRTITIDVEVACEVYPPFAGRGERGFSLGEPPEPAHAELVGLKSPLGLDLTPILEELDKNERKEIAAAAIEAASDDDVADREAAEEAAGDADREERLFGGAPLFPGED